MVGAAADDARAEPLKLRAGRGGIGLAVDDPGPVGREEFAKIVHGLATNAGAAVRQLVGPGPHLEIFFGIDRRTGLEQGYAETAFGQDFGRHTAASAGSNDAYIVSFWRPSDLRHR